MSTRVESIAQPLGREEHARLARRARNLSWLSLLVLGVEGTVAVTAGILANSIALIGFGIDSAIEAFASVIIVWRFTGARTLSEHAERRAQKLVALSFFLLAPYVAFEAIQSLVASEQPETSYLGIGIAVASAVTMPYLGITKKRIGRRLGSRATEGEGTQNLLCAYLAVAVLVGLLANTLFGLWWLDPVVALVIAVVALQEGREAWEGEESGNGPSGIRRAGVTQPE
jgi:divalent metal cation (Fe/Co/Zn/Cd) transporter